ncbi:SUMF1/EgtB/PvdO family nonheme iron enzyme [Streptomyces sp. NPDC057638]|uniref:SUMF1/EgtB/PvdO family nonheme iron enzyme n=1 Tax=Streptomyces sp. NPDC057638 TaxID=3346190 RepID=UPI0036A3E310
MTRKKIFISYQRESAAVARRLHDALQAAGFDAWVDTERIRHTDLWATSIDQALRSADRLVVLLTAKATESREVFNEWFFFYSHRKPIHVVRIDGCELHYQLVPFQRLEWTARAGENEWTARTDALVAALRTSFAWPDGHSPDDAVVTTPFAPARTLPGAFAALEEAIRDRARSVALTDEQLHAIRDHPSHTVREYLLSCYARWCGPRYQLDRRFVRLTLVYDEGTDVADRWVTAPSSRRSDDLQAVLAGSDSFAYVLLGAPGSGKSTLLRRLELDIAAEGVPSPSDAVIPFSVSLAEYGLNTGAPPAPRRWLEERWKARHPQLPELAHFLESGRLLLLLDGLNELAHHDPADLRRRIDAWKVFLYESVRDVPGNRAVFACRTLDYGAMLSSKDVGVPHIRLEPMTRDQVMEYITLHLPEQAGLVRDALDRDARAPSFYRTPYMLRLLVNQVRAVGTVPVGRVDAFAGMVRELLRREILSGNPRTVDPELLTDREQRRLRDGVRDPLWLPDRGHLVPALTRLAYQMQESKRGEDKGSVVVDYDTAVDLLNGLARIAEASLRVGCDTGILDEDEEAIRFFHQLLQEFFAARQLALTPDFSRLAVPDTVATVSPPLTDVLEQLAPGEPLPPLSTTGWEETAVMAAALAEDPDTYVREILAVNPSLAGRCLAAPDVRVDAAVRTEVLRTLTARATDPATDLRARIHYGRILGVLGDPRLTRVESAHGAALLPEFASIPAGRHRIGADGTPYALERPVHEVRLAAFQLARRPVTNAEYGCFIAAGGYEDERWWRSGHARAWRFGEGIQDLIAAEWRKKRDNLRRRPALPVDMLRSGVATLQQAVSMVKLTTMTDQAVHKALTDIYGTEAPRMPAYWYDSLLAHPGAPVVGVSVYEAEAYCAWLSAVTGRPVRLPTEYEWEVAASPGGRVFPYGDEAGPLAANTFELHARGTLPVGVFPEGRSPAGVDDLSGNVFEWTASAPDPYPRDPAAPAVRAPDAPGDTRICRGGSWRHRHHRARAAYRGRGQCFVRNDDLGFRLARSR